MRLPFSTGASSQVVQACVCPGRQAVSLTLSLLLSATWCHCWNPVSSLKIFAESRPQIASSLGVSKGPLGENSGFLQYSGPSWSRLSYLATSVMCTQSPVPSFYPCFLLSAKGKGITVTSNTVFSSNHSKRGHLSTGFYHAALASLLLLMHLLGLTSVYVSSKENPLRRSWFFILPLEEKSKCTSL